MPRYSNSDPSIDECFTVKISMLNKWGHLGPGINAYNRSYIWSRNGQQIASIGYKIEEITDDLKQMTLEYRKNGIPVKYKINIQGVVTNLGNGLRWYFICPPGSKYFLHRSLFPVLMYNSQKKGKPSRTISAIFDWLEEENNLAEQLYQKYRKSLL